MALSPFDAFAALLDQLAYEPRRQAKLALLAEYFRRTPDPDRGYALAALTGSLTFTHAKAGVIRALISERTDETLFRLSYDYVGDLSETVALMWPSPTVAAAVPPTLTSVVETLKRTGKSALPATLAGLLDTLDETGRWALLKLITGGLRIGASARLAKTAVAMLGEAKPDDIELLWPGLSAPYEALFAYAEGRAGKPVTEDPLPFRPVMLAHPLQEADMADIDPSLYAAEWKWDGIRVQLVAASGKARLYSRSGEDITPGFPEIAEAASFDGVIDGELLVVREGRVASFNDLQQRLNRKAVTQKLMATYPAQLRAYDLLAEGQEDLRPLPFGERRVRLEAFHQREQAKRLDLSALVPFADVEHLMLARRDPAAAGAGPDAAAIEGLMLKRYDAPYLPGRPKGLWFKWKREPHVVDAVLMYAQRGHGKRSSYYSDYTFGVWKGEVLTPVGKAYFGFTDEELIEIDRFVRRNTINRFGPVREVMHTATEGMVFEIAFEGLARSTRHKSGVAMRFPRIARLRRDKQPVDADRIETLEAMLEGTYQRP